MVTFKRSDEVLQRLFTDILGGKQGTSGKLPSAQAISEEYGISTASVREALKILEAMGIITLSQGKGIFVDDSTEIIHDLLEARRILEGYNAVQAAKRRSDKDVVVLERLIEQMNQAIQIADISAYSQLDGELHLLIASLSHNRILNKVLETLKLILYVQQVRVNRVPTLLAASHKYHALLVESIKDGDPKAARTHMEDHINSLIEYWTDMADSSAQPPDKTTR